MMRTGFQLACLWSFVLAAPASAQDTNAESAAPEQSESAYVVETPQPTAATVEPIESTPAEPSVERLTEEELRALGIDSTNPAVDTSLKLSGFADFGFGATLNERSSFWRGSGIVPSSPTFYVGNLNVYLDKQLNQTLRTMAEIRFTFLPNGSRGFGFQEREDTTTSDYVDFGRTTRWGSLMIQRIYIEWAPHPLFAVRGGQFLTPYGVWNVDHGTPVYIPVRRPRTLSSVWFPEHQTGLEFFGRAVLSPVHTLGYHLTLSNGDGPISEYADLDDNKAIGGRLFWELHALGWWRLGGSMYYGRTTDAVFQSTFDGNSVKSQERIVTQSDRLSWALDLTWQLEDFHFQAEWLFTELAYTERGRTLREAEVGTLLPADIATLGGYGLVGYRLPWFGIMPFFLAEYVQGGLQDLDISAFILQMGFNIRPVDELVLKLSYERMELEDDLIEPLHTVSAQVAWAF